MPRNPVNKLRDFPGMLYCEPPESNGSENWIVRGDLEPGTTLTAEHPNLVIALARFGSSYYKLKREVGILAAAKRVS